MSLNVNVRRFYKDDQTSYLAVFTVTGSTEDGNKIFVCTNEVLCPVGNEIPGQRVGVYVPCEQFSSSAPSYSFGVSSSGESSSSAQPSSETPSSSAPSSSGSSGSAGSSSSAPPVDCSQGDYWQGDGFVIYPSRVLHTIASCPDMELQPVDEPPDNDSTGFYRVDTVTIMVNTEHTLNTIIDLIYKDIVEHCAIMNKKTPNFELCLLQECADSVDEQYIFPE